VPSNDDVLKVLVDDALGRGVHPDHERTLSEWQDENLSDEEKDARLTDDERAQRELERDGATADDSTPQEPVSPGKAPVSQADSETGREGPPNRAGEDKADTTAPESGKPSTRKAGK
jgi:hypothetical protein